MILALFLASKVPRNNPSAESLVASLRLHVFPLDAMKYFSYLSTWRGLNEEERW